MTAARSSARSSATPRRRVYVIDDYLCSLLPPYADLVAGDDAADARWFTADEVVALDAAGRMAPGVLHALRDWHVLPEPS